MIATGYHSAALAKHFLNKRSADFIEMGLHHFVTVLLYLFSYSFNEQIGLQISFLHDFSDISVTQTKFLGESRYTNIAAVSLFITILLWLYCRCFVFPQILYYIYIVPVYKADNFALTFFLFFAVNISMVLGLAPVVGVTLPLISYGGSSVVTFLIGFGLVSSVSQRRQSY